MTTPTTSLPARNMALHVSLWIAQVLLAAAFGMAGYLKALTPMPQLGEQIFWAKDVPLAFTRFIGISEAAGALGLILPAATRIKPILTAYAAGALVFVMVSAIGFHLLRGEAGFITGPVILGLLAAFVAWGRFTNAPILPR